MKFRKNDGKLLTAEYYLFRENARRTAFHEENFSDADREEFDLETAGITGEDNNDNYRFNRPVDTLGQNGTDVRDLPRH